MIHEYDLADFDTRFFQKNPEGFAFLGLQRDETGHQTKNHQRYRAVQNRFCREMMITYQG